MKRVTLATLESAIIRPGIESRLVPLLHFKGHADLGRFHRLWNLVVSMHEHECEGVGEGVTHLALNPAYSQLCLPVKPTAHTTMYGFLSRLQAHPEVARERAGLLDYARMLMPRPFPLVPVSANANRNRHAWWRSFESAMPAWRARLAAQKAERLAARQKERDARLADREAARAERREIVLRHREERAREKARLAREPKKFVLRETSAAPLAYPYLIHRGGRPEHELLRRINDAVPRGVMGDLRADICQDLAVGILCGDFAEEDLGLGAKEVIRRVRRLFPEKYGPLSLDAPVPGTDNLRLIDTI